VPPEDLFRDYAYFSSFAESALRSAEDLATRLARERGLGPGDLVVEAASNDGYLLQFYRGLGIGVLGIEPARNVAAVALRERGVPTLVEFFGETVARRLRDEGRAAAVFHAHNVLAHVADLNGFVEGMRVLLREDGVAVVEVPYVRDMLDKGEFDTIYHEHLCYFSLTALHELFSRHRLVMADVEHLPLHGGSVRLFVTHGQTTPEEVRRMLDAEQAWGVARDETYERFRDDVARVQRRLDAFLRGLRARGATIAAYGAAAKGVILLNSLGVGADVLEFVVDRSPHKQGRYLPGVRVPIRPPEALLAERPDYVLLLAWNLEAEVLAQQAEYRRGGGRFIVPIPELRIV